VRPGGAGRAPHAGGGRCTPRGRAPTGVAAPAECGREGGWCPPAGCAAGVQAGPGVNLALAIGTPPRVGRRDPRGRLARRAEGAPVTVLRDQAVAAPEIADWGAPRPRPARMTWVQARQRWLGAPCRVPTTPRHEGRNAVLRRLIRAGAWGARTILQTWWTGGEIALHPRVARLTTDAVQRAHLSERQRSSPVVAIQWICWAMGHGCLQGMGHRLGGPCVPSQCDPCPWTQL
jgi:hypothetical protein